MVELMDQEAPSFQCLFDILLSLPEQQGYLDWRHDYGGILRVNRDKSQLFPADDRIINGMDHDRVWRTDAGTLIYKFDPLEVPELLEIRSRCLTSVDDANGNDEDDTPQNPIHIRPGFDPFQKLPAEILQMILHLLPSRDVLYFKLASPVTAATPLLESFWASRFFCGHELDHIFEGRLSARHPKFWKRFYFGVRSIADNPSLRNRRRISNLITPLRTLLSEYSLSTCYGTQIESFFEPDAAPLGNESWISGALGVVKHDEPFHRGSRALRIRQICLPDLITGLAVSFTQFGQKRYISDIRFKQKTGVDTRLGYVRREHEEEQNTAILQQDEPCVHISGFILAMDRSGLRGMALVTACGTSKWFGDHEGIPTKHLVVGHERVLLLKAGFDAVRIVLLAVSTKQPNGTLSCTKLPSLREEAFWLPDIPPTERSFKDHFSIKPWVARAKSPYNVVMFGGRTGENLSKLVQMVVWIVDLERIYGIEFKYNTEIDGRKTHTLGQRGPFLDTEPREEPPLNSSTDRVEVFDVDGPGGEMISQVLLKSRGGGKLSGFWVHTNRGRQTEFPSPRTENIDEDDDDEFILLDTTEKAIIGFYDLLKTSVVVDTLGVVLLGS